MAAGGVPWLPLDPAHASSLVRALDAALPPDGAPPRDAVTALLTQLVTVLRAERAHVLEHPPPPGRRVLRRMRRDAAARRAAADFRPVPDVLNALVEEVRAALDDPAAPDDASIVAGVLARRLRATPEAPPPDRWTVRQALRLLA